MNRIKIMTYNIQHGANGLGEIKKAIEQSDADVIGMNEVDCYSARSLYVDQAAWLAQKLNMNYIFGPAMNQTYGNAILTKFPVLRTKNLLFSPFEKGGKRLERRACLFVYLQGPFGKMSIFVVHLGLDYRERQEQVKEMLPFIAKNQNGLTFLLGDFNTTSDSGELILVENKFYRGTDTVFTYPVPFPKHQIDYIFVNEKSDIEYRVIDTKASDHYPLLCNYTKE